MAEPEALESRPNTMDVLVGAVLSLVALFMAAVVASSLAASRLGVDPLTVEPGENPLFDQLLYAVSLPLGGLLIAAVVWSMLARLPRPVSQSLGLGRARNWWALSLVVPAGLCADRAVSLARAVLPGAELGSLGGLSSVADVPGLLGALLVFGLVFCGPVSEELLFRGLVYGGLQRDRGTGQAIVFSALMFGLFHLDPVHIAGAVVIGLYLGWLRALTGSLWPVLLAHALNNGIWVLLVRTGRSEMVLPLWTEILAGMVLFFAVLLTRGAWTTSRV